MKVWLDDIRPAPDGWTHVFTAWEAIKLLETFEVSEISLDHDLGEASGYGMNDHPGTGYDVCKWMAEYGKFPRIIWIHSRNPVGSSNMFQLLMRYCPDGTQITKV